MRIIIETIRNLLKPLINLAGILLTIYYIFAQLGMFMFGGLVYQNSPFIDNDPGIPNTYHLMNFNDLLSSFCTLFALMVVNNWFVVVKVYTNTMGSNWYQFYFGLFYYFSVVIGINIVVAFALDMYSSVERLDQERIKTLDILQEDLELTKIQRNENRMNDIINRASIDVETVNAFNNTKSQINRGSSSNRLSSGADRMSSNVNRLSSENSKKMRQSNSGVSCEISDNKFN